jgi:hypothetical protein
LVASHSGREVVFTLIPASPFGTMPGYSSATPWRGGALWESKLQTGKAQEELQTESFSWNRELTTDN